MVNHRESWLLRPLDEVDDDEDFYDIYDKNQELFTIKVHFKGCFEETPLREYVGGELRIIDQVNEEYFNLTDVDVIALGAGYGYKKFCLYFWQRQNERPILILPSILREMLESSEEDDIDCEASAALRALKGKAKLSEAESIEVHKRVRFTQGTAVEESVNDFADPHEYLQTQEDELTLDGLGELLDKGRNNDYSFGDEEDACDNADLKAEVIIEQFQTDGVQSNVEQDIERELASSMHRLGVNDDVGDKHVGSETTEHENASTFEAGSGSGVKGKNRKYLTPYERYRNAKKERHPEGNVSEDMSEYSDNAYGGLDDKDMDVVGGHSSDSEDDHPLAIPFDMSTMMNPTLQVNMVFSSKADAKEALTWYALQTKKPIKCIFNDKRRLKFVCEHPCKWSCLISPSVYLGKEDFKIKKLSARHKNCPLNRTEMGNSKFMAKAFEELISNWPDIRLSILQVAIKQKFGIVMSINAVRATKKRAMEKINGDNMHQYKLIWDYANELKRTNLGSTVIVDYDERFGVNEDSIFKRIYICLRPLVNGFKYGCRKLIGLDGCHTKGLYRQQILTAVFIDANNGWWPIAWVIVEQENLTTWSWFLNYLQQDCAIPNNNTYVFISDKQKGLEGALHDILPNCLHRNCVLHLYKNFQKHHRGVRLRDHFWACARSSNQIVFERNMARLKDLDSDAHTWLVEHGVSPTRWSKAFFPLTVKTDMLCNNLSESFNSFILSARDKPIIKMLEMIRRLCMARIKNRRIAMERKSGDICPRIMKLLEDRSDHSHSMQIQRNGEDDYEVDYYGTTYHVNVRTRECNCRLWQLTGIPCAHAIPCLNKKGYILHDYVDECYSRRVFLETYSNVLYPTTSAEFWVNSNGLPLAPPNCVRLAGRPKKSRRRGEDEVSQKRGVRTTTRRAPIRCGICKSLSHNRRSCPQRHANATQETSGCETTRRRDRGDDTRPPNDNDQAAPKADERTVHKRRRKTQKQQDLEKLQSLIGETDGDENLEV